MLMCLEMKSNKIYFGILVFLKINIEILKILYIICSCILYLDIFFGYIIVEIIVFKFLYLLMRF